MILGAVRTNFGSISASKPRNVSVKRAQITNRNVPVSYVAKRNFVLPARLTSSHPVSKQTVSLPKIHSNLSLNSSLLFKTVKVTTPTLRFGDLQVRYYSSNEEYPEHIVLEMPALSPTMNTGTITKWLRKEGDKISSGTQIADIETDKATLAWESVDDGYLAKILLPDGTTDIAVGNAVAILAASEKDIPAFANYSVGGASTPAPALQTTQKEEPSTPAPTPASQTTSNAKQPSTPAPSSGRVFASPAAKATAAASGKDLQGIVGTGPNNRIIKADVLEFEPPTQVRVTVPSSGANYTDIPNSKVRAITASRLTQSKQTIPHYYLTVDFSVDKLQKLRSELNSLSKDYKLSVNDFVIKATALALRDVPEVNSQWNDTSIRRFHDVHINVAVNTDNGLFTPILQFTDKLGLKSINKSVKELADKAHDAKLTPADLEIGTFTISNLGMYGIKNFSAVINPPQACILAVGGIEQRVVPSDKEGEFKISNYMSVTLSCDHRVVDGALGAVWLKSFKGYMENPMTLIL